MSDAPVSLVEALPEAILARLYPGFFREGGPAFVPADDRAFLMILAGAYRPACLTPTQQNLAQAYYAAHLLQGFLAERRAETPGGVTTPVNYTSGVILRQREGDKEIQYASPKDLGGAVVADGSVSSKAPYELWKQLNDMCKLTGSNGQVIGTAPVQRRGVIMTRFGIAR